MILRSSARWIGCRSWTEATSPASIDPASRSALDRRDGRPPSTCPRPPRGGGRHRSGTSVRRVGRRRRPCDWRSAARVVPSSVWRRDRAGSRLARRCHGLATGRTPGAGDHQGRPAGTSVSRAGSRPSAACRSPSPPARPSRSSARTGRARPRSSNTSMACSGRLPGMSRLMAGPGSAIASIR